MKTTIYKTTVQNLNNPHEEHQHRKITVECPKHVPDKAVLDTYMLYLKILGTRISDNDCRCAYGNPVIEIISVGYWDFKFKEEIMDGDMDG